MVNGPSLFRSAWSYVADTLTPVTDWISAASFLSAGQTYYYVVTALASGGVRSGYSNEVSATIPTP